MRALIVLLVLACAALIAALLTRRHFVLAEPLAPAAAANAGIENSAEGGAPPATPTPAETKDRVPALPPAIDLPPAPEDPSLWRILVVDARGAPAANASVWITHCDTAPMGPRNARSDASGICDLASRQDRADIHVRIGQQFALLRVPQATPQRVFRLDLAREIDMAVQIQQGTAVADRVTVEVAIERPNAAGGDAWHVIEKSITVRGRALVKRWHARLTAVWTSLLAPAGAVLDAFVSPPPQTRVRIHVQPFAGAAVVIYRRLGDDWTEPIEITLPGYGEILCTMPELEDIDETFAWLELNGAQGSGGGRRSERLRHGELRFDRIPIGEHYLLRWQLGNHANQSQLVEGPKREGEQVEVRLDQSLVAIWTGRAVDSAGAPCRGRRLEIEVPGRAIWHCRTDESGRFKFLTEPGGASGAVMRLQKAANQFAQSRLPESNHCGVLELGDLKLDLAPAIASGVIVDDRGAPVLDCQARIERRFGGDFQTARSHTVKIQGHEFVVRGPAEPGQLWIRLRHNRQEQRVLLQSEPMRCVLPAAGNLSGRLIAADTATLGDCQIRLLSKDPSVIPRFTGPGESHSESADGLPFEFRELAPGTYDLSVTTGWSSATRASIEGLVVPSGGACTDPRLRAIQVETGREIWLEISDSTGRPLDGKVLCRRGELWQEIAAFHGGLAMLVAPAEGVDLQLVSPGFESTVLRGVRTNRSVQMTQKP